MKTFLIKIDKKSIKKNPNAGNKIFRQYLGSNITFTIKEHHDSIENSYIRRTHYQWGTSGTFSTYCVLNRIKDNEILIENKPIQELIDELKVKFGDNFSYVITNNYDTMHSMFPSSEYLFKYKDTKVKCVYCKKSFSYTKLYDDYDDWEAKLNICPECNTESCCKIQYESIEGYVLKQAKLPKMQVG